MYKNFIKGIDVYWHNIKVSFYRFWFDVYTNLMKRYQEKDSDLKIWKVAAKKGMKWLKKYTDEIDTFWDRFYEKY